MSSTIYLERLILIHINNLYIGDYFPFTFIHKNFKKQQKNIFFEKKKLK